MFFFILNKIIYKYIVISIFIYWFVNILKIVKIKIKPIVALDADCLFEPLQRFVVQHDDTDNGNPVSVL